MEPSSRENIFRVISELEERIDRLDKKVDEINEQVNKRIDDLADFVKEFWDTFKISMRNAFSNITMGFNSLLVMILTLPLHPEHLFKLIEIFSETFSILEKLNGKELSKMRSHVLKMIIDRAGEIKCDVGDLAERLVKHFSPGELLSPEVKNLVMKNFGHEGLVIWEKIVG